MSRGRSHCPLWIKPSSTMKLNPERVPHFAATPPSTFVLAGAATLGRFHTPLRCSIWWTWWIFDGLNILFFFLCFVIKSLRFKKLKSHATLSLITLHTPTKNYFLHPKERFNPWAFSFNSGAAYEWVNGRSKNLGFFDTCSWIDQEFLAIASWDQLLVWWIESNQTRDKSKALLIKIKRMSHKGYSSLYI